MRLLLQHGCGMRPRRRGCSRSYSTATTAAVPARRPLTAGRRRRRRLWARLPSRLGLQQPPPQHRVRPQPLRLLLRLQLQQLLRRQLLQLLLLLLMLLLLLLLQDSSQHG